MADLKNYVRFSEKKDVQIKQNMKYALSGYKFLKENVFNYTHTMYYFDNKVIQKFVLNISNNDFAHLCGIEYLNGNKNFGKDLMANRVNWDKIMIKKDGTTLLKLSVISSIHLLFTTNAQLESGGRCLDLVYDKMLRTNRLILGIGCKQLNSDNHIPLSLLDLRKFQRDRKKVNRYDIVCVIRKNKQNNQHELLECVDSFDAGVLGIEF